MLLRKSLFIRHFTDKTFFDISMNVFVKCQVTARTLSTSCGADIMSWQPNCVTHSSVWRPASFTCLQTFPRIQKIQCTKSFKMCLSLPKMHKNTCYMSSVKADSIMCLCSVHITVTWLANLNGESFKS